MIIWKGVEFFKYKKSSLYFSLEFLLHNIDLSVHDGLVVDPLQGPVG